MDVVETETKPTLPDRGARSVERFETMSLLLKRFSTLTGSPLLSVDQGARRFFNDFGVYMNAPLAAPARRTLGVAADPADFLAFPTGLDELQLAISRNGGRRDDVATLAGQFGIPADLLNQPIRHLSGGERSLFALAKAYALADEHDGIVLANPATWLHESRRSLIDVVTERFLALGKPATILLLAGDWLEADQTQLGDIVPADLTALTFYMSANGLKVRFPETAYPAPTPERTIMFDHEGESLLLSSPVLVRGDNGIGKSTLALVLAQVREADAGRAYVRVGGITGAARMLLQDTSRQMFAMCPADHAHHTFRYDAERRKKVDELVAGLEREVADLLATTGAEIGETDSTGRVSSILHAKLTLAVERIVMRPALLVLDEPSWGLSATLARMAALLISRTAHQNGVPVAIISHETRWLDGLAHSILSMSRSDASDTVILRAEHV